MKRKIYKHKYVVMVLSEQRHDEDVSQYSLEVIQYSITHGPDLGDVELESVEEITNLDQIETECLASRNDGGFFTELWDELDAEEG